VDACLMQECTNHGTKADGCRSSFACAKCTTFEELVPSDNSILQLSGGLRPNAAMPIINQSILSDAAMWTIATWGHFLKSGGYNKSPGSATRGELRPTDCLSGTRKYLGAVQINRYITVTTKSNPWPFTNRIQGRLTYLTEPAPVWSRCEKSGQFNSPCPPFDPCVALAAFVSCLVCLVCSSSVRLSVGRGGGTTCFRGTHGKGREQTPFDSC
jgi:hypothetical protein